MSLEQLKRYADAVNIACELEKTPEGLARLEKIGQDAVHGFNEDKKSMEIWLRDTAMIEELAGLTIIKKNTPLPNSSNVKLPIITKACYEFSSAAYPEIVRGEELVKAHILGYDDNKQSKKDMAERVAKYMNYQLLFENQEWEEELDRLLTILGIVGLVYKKTYYDPVRKKIRSEVCDSKEVIINSDAHSIDKASRISHIIHYRLNDFVEAKLKKYGEEEVFRTEVVDELVLVHGSDTLDKQIDIVEQHCRLDLDDDGYAEPYIVTFTMKEGKVLRIAPRFTADMICFENDAVCYIDSMRIFIDFHFLTSPKGKFQSVGFGFLLLHLTEASNSILNQLIDAGQLANMQGGWKDARLKMLPSGNSLHDPGEFKEVKVMPGSSLKEGLVPMMYKEPSAVLHSLLGFLHQVCADLTASAQINNGTQSSENAKTGATQLLQEAGKKLANSINKRIYRSLNKEFRQIFILNSIYLDETSYYDVLQTTEAIKKDDFDPAKIKILPVADPDLASSSKRMAAAQFVQQLVAGGMQGIDPVKATAFILKQTSIPDIMGIMADPNAKQPPNPALMQIQVDAEHKSQQVKLEAEKLHRQDKQQMVDAHLAQAEVDLKSAQIRVADAQALLYAAQAMAVPEQTKLAAIQVQLDAVSTKLDAQMHLVDHAKDLTSQALDHSHEQGMQQAQQQHEQQQQDSQQQADQQQQAQQPDSGGASDENS